ncbi:hypothetical protein Tsubulata_010259 [Turnera subulata]|uniref:Neprosin PEP catalytic domain-containing protein n=1 Tax=Turnera subulata TaxID=218843 RepID=A0A9Q0JNH9_9ROSI|nr:hypothetical protein Tsubulata_010259 [Turnera subulata]
MQKLLRGKDTDRNYSSKTFSNNIWLNGHGCPLGTIPIKKVKKEDIIRSKLVSRSHHSGYSPQSKNDPGLHYAKVRTNDIGSQYNGAHMFASVYNPIVQNSQASYSRMKIQKGMDSIEVGWTVNPPLYNDNRTRIYIYTNSAQNKRWNLEIGDEGIIGWWPDAIFNDLAGMADYVDWGGQVFTPTNIPSPPMGSGNAKLYEDTKKDAYCGQITILDENSREQHLKTKAMLDVIQYDVIDEGNVGGPLQHLFNCKNINMPRPPKDWCPDP